MQLGKIILTMFLCMAPWSSLACPISDPGGISAQSVTDPIPTTGNQKLLVILADFADEPGTITQKEFRDQFFDGWSSGTFREFFLEGSDGLLSYTGDVVGISGGQAVVNGSGVTFVRLPNNKSFYSGAAAGTNIGDFPRNLVGVTYHAVQALEAVNFDFSPYANAQGIVDNLVVIFAGPSSVESQNQNDLQPTAYSLSVEFSGGYTTSGGQKIKNFTFCPETSSRVSGPAGLGVCVHEHGHGMGMPDLYDLSYTTSGVGYFSLMAYGVYTRSNATRPAHVGPYARVLWGWTSPTVVENSTVELDLAPVLENGDVIKVLPTNGSSTEYFLPENRQHSGFDSSMDEAGLCTGLLIWHIDESITGQYTNSNLVNTLPSSGGPPHQGVLLLEADGGKELITAPRTFGECEDRFQPGRTLSASTSPSSRLWDGSDSGIWIQVLSETNGTLRVRISNEGDSTPPEIPTPTPTPEPTATPEPGNGPNPEPTAAPTNSPNGYRLKVKGRKKALNGKLTLNGGAVASATVELQYSPKKQDNFEAIQTITSNNRGKFKFKRLRSGKYRVQAMDGTVTSNTVKLPRKGRKK